MHNEENHEIMPINTEQTSSLTQRKTILDMLESSICSSMGTKRTIKKIEKIILNPTMIKELTFDQLIMWTDRLIRLDENEKNFIIDFYRVTSKQAEVQSILRQYNLINTKDANVIENSSSDPRDSAPMRATLLAKLEEILRREQKEKEEQGE